MTYQAKIIADSVSSAGKRITTLEVTFPRLILAEFNTHRMLSRNGASSRAIPVTKRIKAVRDDGPFLPDGFTRNKPGMQGGEELDGEDGLKAAAIWAKAAAFMVVCAEELAEIGVHKQYANRLLEPFLWHTHVVTATEWDNFFHLRDHPDATPEFQRIARMMRDAMAQSTPVQREWHLPYVRNVDVADLDGDAMAACFVSAARCARVSYLTHDGKRDLDADRALAQKLMDAGHMSPFEHPAQAMRGREDKYGNFRGWRQLRHRIAAEDDRLGPRGLNTARKYPDA